MESLWNKNCKIKTYESLSENIKTDVLIVGGGMCGILCAYMLKKENVNCVILEKDRICGGTTNNTTAKLTFQHGLIYGKIFETYGKEKAELYYKSQSEAFNEFKRLAKDADCDYESLSSYVYSVDNRDKIENEVKALEAVGCQAEFLSETELPLKIAGAVKIENQGAFNPLKFVSAVSDGISIYENTRVLKIKDGYAITSKGRVEAKKIIIATHFPFINKYGGYFLKMYQHRSYVTALNNVKNVAGMYVDEAPGGLSFRPYGEFLFIGGGGHRTGKTDSNFIEFTHVKEKHYPKSFVIAQWAAQDCMTLDGIPYVGRYSKSTPDLYVATGFNKWGMTSSMVAAMLLTDIITGKGSDYEEVYLPERSIIHPQLAINAFESLKGLLTPTAPRCPHLGCALKYNKYEHSWDCSCHGSRFENNGSLIDGPATHGMKKE